MTADQNDNDAGRAFERALIDDWQDVSASMLRLPAIVGAVESRRVFTLTCPRGHKLFPATLGTWENDGHTLVMIEPLDDRGKAGAGVTRASVTKPSTPFSGGASTVCLQPGCPTTIKGGPGRCQDHGARRAIAVDPMGTDIECQLQSHKWKSRIRLPTLLEWVTVALVAGQASVPVTGHASVKDARRRRRA